MFTLKIQNYWQDAVRNYQSHNFSNLESLYEWLAKQYNDSMQPNKKCLVLKRNAGYIELQRIYEPRGFCGFYGDLWVEEIEYDGITIFDKTEDYCSPKLKAYLEEHPFEDLIKKKVLGDF